MAKKRPLPDTQIDRDFVANIQAGRIKSGLSEADLAVFLRMTTRTLNDRLKEPEKFSLFELRVLKKRLKIEIII